MAAVRTLLKTLYPWSPWPMLDVAVNGDPAPQGSKSFKGISKSGKAILVESSKRVKPWRDRVQDALELHIAIAGSDAFPLTEPVGVQVIFTVRKPASAPKRRRIFPSKRPDIDKLLRAVLDACTQAGVWKDDSQVVEQYAVKVFPAESEFAGSVPGVRITIYRIRENAE